MKTSELIGPTLDLMVSRASNPPGRDGWGWFKFDVKGFLFDPLNEERYSPSTDWEQGGPIIEREKISVEYSHEGDWHATIGCTPHDFLMWDQPYNTDASYAEGPTPLTAAMRAYVASKLGDEVEIPEELK